MLGRIASTGYEIVAVLNVERWVLTIPVNMCIGATMWNVENKENT
jgi:hypothetical protein